MTNRVKDTEGAVMNLLWRRQQAELRSAGQQKPVAEPRIAVPMVNGPCIAQMPNQIEKIPLAAIQNDFPGINKGTVGFQKFLVAFERQLRARQVKPIIVRKSGDEFVLVDGARRVAAAESLGLTYLPGIVEVPR